MIRAYAYVLAAGIVWMVEGFLFSHFLKMVWWQVALLACLYLGLFGLAMFYLLRSLQRYQGTEHELAAWRAISLAPMMVVIIGSFASLPLILAVAALGKVL